MRRLRRLEDERQQKLAAERRELDEQAEVARIRAIHRAEAQDFRGALSEFKSALELASLDWPARAQVQNEIEALALYLENGE